MSAAPQYASGPLAWVRSEITQSLDTVRELIDVVLADPGDHTPMQNIRVHLHQVTGALQMVGLEGAAHFSHMAEILAERLDRPDPGGAQSVPDALRGALTALGQYLDALMAGEPNIPLRLFPAYSRIMAARGEKANEADLFFPDLAAVPPIRPQAPSLSITGRFSLVGAKRVEYQRALVSWLRNNDDARSLQIMRDALLAVQRSETEPVNQAFWWSAGAFLDSLLNRGLPYDAAVKQVCGRIDLQIRRVCEDLETVSERTLAEVLFWVARSKPVTDRVREVKQVYRLEEMLPPGMAGDGPDADGSGRLGEMRECLAGLKEAWLQYSSTAAGDPGPFTVQASRMLALARAGAQPALEALIEQLARVGQHLSDAPDRPVTDQLGLEVATALLLLEGALEQRVPMGDEFPRQCEAMIERLQDAAAGIPVDIRSSSSVHLLSDLSRRAQDRMLLTQIAREINDNLRHVEQAVDAFFRDPARREPLAALDGEIGQVCGALRMLEWNDAAELMEAARAHIAAFARGAPAGRHEADLVAETVSGLALYVGAMQQGQPDALSVIVPALRRVRGQPSETPASPVERYRSEVEEKFDEWLDEPSDAERTHNLTEALQALRGEAAIRMENDVAQQSSEALALLRQQGSQPEETDELRRAVETLTQLPVQPEPEPPSGPVTEPIADAGALMIPERSSIDPELTEIFLEEAREVLETIDGSYHACIERPADREAMVTIRRGFHTLKGSGRMVGLRDLAAGAWAVEQTLNLHLQEDGAATPAILDLVAQARDAFRDWVARLAADPAAAVDPAHLIAAAERVRAPAVETAAPEAPATMEPVVQESGAQETTTVRIGDVTLSRRFLAIYLEEADNLLATQRGQLEQLCAAREQPLPFDFVRAAHTLSGISSTAGILSVADLGHALDGWLQAVVEHPQPLPADDLGVVGRTLDRLAEMVAMVREGMMPPHAPELAYELEAARHRLRAAPAQETAPVADHAEPPEAERTTPVAPRDTAPHDGWLAPVDTHPPQETWIEPPAAPAWQQETGEPARIAALLDTGPVSAVPDMALPVAQMEHVAASPVDAVVSTASDPATIGSPPAAPSQTVAPAAGVVAPRPPVVALMPRHADDIDEQLLPVFLEEADEMVPLIGQEMRAWRAHPRDSEAPDALGRLLHTLKGGARMTGAMMLGELTHGLEQRVMELRALGQPAIQDFDDLDARLDAAVAGIDALRPGRGGAATPAAGQPAARAPVVVSTSAVRVRVDTVDRLANEAGEVSIARSRVEGEAASIRQALHDLGESVQRMRNQLREVEIQAESQIQSRVSQLRDDAQQFDPLELDRYTRLQELTRFMAESVNDVGMLQQNIIGSLDEVESALRQQARMSRDLQQSLLSIRMVPFSQLADRLYRLVRQTSRELERRAVLELSGERTELDRSVLEKITAPLEHLLRNALSHGIERGEERLRAGKPEAGTLRVDVRQAGNEVTITLSDDGRGLDLQRIRAKAVETGVIPVDADLGPAELMQLIFRPGFSTADAVTEVAGRGVGMDVVRNDIVGAGGRIEVQSLPGKGTTFTLALPVTLAVTQTLLVRAGDRVYAIPSSLVEQLMQIRTEPLAELYGSGAAVWQGQRYPFFHLRRLLGEADVVQETRRTNAVLLLKSGSQRTAVHVDEVMGNQEVVVKNVGPQLSRLVGVVGATVLGNGTIALILNPVPLAYRQQQPALFRPGTAPAAAQARETRPLVLVVDDSLTVRKATSRLLTREGYQVMTAKDGAEALEQVIDLQPAVILLDIEMPRMDGFEFTRHLRGDPRTQHIPIIMITSRSAEKHRSYAFHLGVDEYLGKPWQEDLLLDHIARFAKAGRSPVDA